jgi:catalase
LAAEEHEPLLVEDQPLFDKQARRHRERISERVVHLKGSTALGTLRFSHEPPMRPEEYYRPK